MELAIDLDEHFVEMPPPIKAKSDRAAAFQMAADDLRNCRSVRRQNCRTEAQRTLSELGKERPDAA